MPDQLKAPPRPYFVKPLIVKVVKAIMCQGERTISAPSAASMRAVDKFKSKQVIDA